MLDDVEELTTLKHAGATAIGSWKGQYIVFILQVF